MAIGLVLLPGCPPSPTAPFYRGCGGSVGCPPGWHCTVGSFCSRYCAGDVDCTAELGPQTYCAATRDCWLRCGGDGGTCSGSATCELGACLYPTDAGAGADP